MAWLLYWSMGIEKLEVLYQICFFIIKKYFKSKITFDLYANPTAPATISKMKMIPNRTANVVTMQQFSLIAPQHPKNPTQKTITPTTMRNTGTLAKLLSA